MSKINRASSGPMTLTRLADAIEARGKSSRCECGMCKEQPALVAALRELDERRARQSPEDVSCMAVQDRTDLALSMLEGR